MDRGKHFEPIEIISRSHGYKVRFEDFSVCDASMIMLIDATVQNLYFSSSDFNSKPIMSSEAVKTLSTVGEVLTFMADNKMTARSQLHVVGGGVVQDIATMAASIYKRGTPWVYIPTTLQSMMDSCIGGKSSINHGAHKNILGNFHPPAHVIIDTDFLASLSIVDLVCGLVEGAKICVAANNGSLQHFLQVASGLDIPYNSTQQELWDEIIHLSLSQKKTFIEEDEFDRGSRRLLNFGHTFGHALESTSDFLLPHGIGVGLGMMMAVEMSQSPETNSMANLLRYLKELLTPILPSYLEKLLSLDKEKFLEHLGQDKKSETEFYTFVIPGFQGLELVKYEKSERVNQEIMTAVFAVLEGWVV